MALNLIKELSNQGCTRKKNKSFLLNRVKNYNTQDIDKKNKILFNDPNTFLKLPNETEFDFIINKIPRGPQYDLYNKLIPYTMVGNNKFIKMNKFQSVFGSKYFNRKSFNQKSKIGKLTKNNVNKNEYNLITDKEIEEIFDNYKNKINENKNKHKDLIDKNECPKVMKQYIDKNLSLQEKCLKKNNDNAINFRNFKGKISQKMKIDKNLYKKKTKSYSENNSSNKDIHLSVGEVIMNSGEENKYKNQLKNLVDKSVSEFILPEVNQKWENSLRNDNKRMLNFKLHNHPYWIYPSEKNMENIMKNKKININYSLYNNNSSKTSSLQNFFNQESKKSINNDDINNNCFKKNFTSDFLEIKGKKLIDVEEKINKNLKGKKKIVKFKNLKEEVKDMIIYSNYTYNNYQNYK